MNDIQSIYAKSYYNLEEQYYELLNEIMQMNHNMRIMRSSIRSMISKGADEPLLNGEPISSHDFWNKM